MLIRPSLTVMMASLPLFSVRAQQSVCGPVTQTFFEYQVPKPAEYLRKDTTQFHPALDPRAVIRAHHDSLVVQFIVDTLGYVVPGTFRILRGREVLQDSTVRRAAREWQFVPGHFETGCRVPQLVQTPLSIGQN